MRFASFRLVIGFALIAASVFATQATAGAQGKAPFQTGPPPVINLANVPGADIAAVQAFEAHAVDQVRSTHGLPLADTAAVLGWGRNDVRAQEWLDLANIVNEPPATRAANAQDAAVYDWFQRAYAQQQVLAAQDAISEYQFWSGGSIASTAPPIGFGAPVTTSLRGTKQTIQTGYCNFLPPGGTDGPFAGTYKGNDDIRCFPPYDCPEGLPVCSTSYPTVEQFQDWGSYDALNKQVATPDFATVSLGTAAAIGVGASLAVAGITTALSAAFGGAGIASSVTSAIFPFASRVFYEFFVGGLDAATAGADAAAASGALTAGAIAFVVGIAIFFIVSTALAIVQIVQDQAIAGQLQAALASAQQSPTPDLAPVAAQTSGYAALFATFLAQTQPDVDFECSPANDDPCADAPAPAGQNLSADPQFVVTTSSGGVPTTVVSPTIYAENIQTATYNSTRLSGNGWFVSTKYPENATTKAGPSGAPGATFESLQFPYTDWNGNHWMVERILDPSTGNPEFARTPLDATLATGCTSSVATTSTGALACVTDRIDVQEPDGTDMTVQVVPAGAAAPSVAAEVPANSTIGVSTALRATGSDPSNLPLSYSWLIECPGTYIGTVAGHSGYAGFPCDLTGGGSGDTTLATTVTGSDTSFTFQQPGLYPVTVTASDTNGYSASQRFDLQLTGSTTTVVAAQWPGKPAAPTFGEPVTYTATVSPVICACSSGLGGTLYPGGYVQFSVDGVPYGGAVPLVQGVDSSSASAVLPIDDLSVTPTGSSGHVVTAEYQPGIEYLAGSGSAPIISASQGFLGSDGTAPSVSVAEGSTSTDVQTTWSSAPTLPVYGQPVGATATVSPSGNSSLTPTGQVQFFVSGAPDGAPVRLDALGQASVALTDLPVTPACNPFLVCLGNQLTATYVGDAGYQSSTSTSSGIFVTKAATSTVGGPDSSGTPVSGQSTKLDALIQVSAPGQAVPTGTITYKDGPTDLGTVPIAYSFTIGGLFGVPLQTYYVAPITTSALRAGTHTITASYNGDAHTGTSSVTFSLAVAKDAAAATVSLASPTVVDGAPTSYDATVKAKAPGSGTPTGTVTFYNGSSAVAGCVNVALGPAGTASCATVAPTTAGVQSVSAHYSGNSDFTAAVSGGASQQVLYGFDRFWRPLLEHNLLRPDLPVTVSFLLVNADGSLVTSATASALAQSGRLNVVFAGPGISPITSRCAWINSLPQHLSCDFTPPDGLSTTKWYTVTAYERVGGTFWRIPSTGPSSLNPVHVHF